MAGSSTHDGGRWSLRELMRERLTHEMLDQFAHEPTGLVLCVDAVTLSIVSSAFRMSELLERNVHLVENVTMVDDAGNYLRRQRLPQLPVLYFLTPAVESVNRLLDDYRDARNPMYGACHLFWSSRLSVTSHEDERPRVISLGVAEGPTMTGTGICSPMYSPSTPKI